MLTLARYPSGGHDEPESKRPRFERAVLLLLLAMAVATCVASLLKPFANVTYTDGLGLGTIQRPGGNTLSLFSALHECVMGSNRDLNFTGRLLAFFVLGSSCVGVAGLMIMFLLVLTSSIKNKTLAFLRPLVRMVANVAVDALQLDVFWVAVMLVHGRLDALAHSMRPELIMSTGQISKIGTGRWVHCDECSCCICSD